MSALSSAPQGSLEQGLLHPCMRVRVHRNRRVTLVRHHGDLTSTRCQVSVSAPLPGPVETSV